MSLSGKNTGYDLGLNLQYNTQSGLDFALIGGVSYQSGANFKLQNGLNSRTGLKDLTLTTGFNINGFGPVSASYGYDFGFAQRTYFPVSDLPLQNLSANVNVRLGPELIAIHGGLNISGYYSGQGLAKKKITNNAYGYLFHSDGKKDETGLLDYNKEKERPYRRDMPIIPMPFGTYDVFSATGQGVSGQFRATRNDVAGLSKARYANASTSASVGIELGGGQAFRFGGDVNIVQSNSEVVEWKDLNPVLKTNMNHTESSDLYESVFFKSMGENLPTESSFYTTTGGTNAIKVDLKKDSGKDVATIAAFKPEKNKVALAAVNISGQLKRNSREKRNQVFSYLDAEEATQMGLDRIIKNHPIGQITYGCSPGSLGTVNRVATTDEINLYKTNFRQKHHISEISVTNPDGQRYVYGIPAYNNDQQEVTFSVAKDNNSINPGHADFGLVPYTTKAQDPNNYDNSTNNQKGKENYFDRQIIPSYAYAYLITGVLSPDYVDRTGDGITDDDLGNAVKFNYSRLTHQYQWRVPFQAGRARLQAGRKSDSGGQTDDKGHYLYGKKEIWYVHSIESRNMVAQFYLSDREDAYGVQGEDGGLNITLAGQKLKKLDSIRVFSKSDLRINSSNPTPIKTVIFEYDPTYPLCSKVPNNSTANRGKLTLKKVYFTYGKSRKGKLNAYVFSYGNNQDYSTWKYDRWGNYQNNGVAYTHNLDFPYTLQNPLLLNSGTWSLNQIILPSGGKITVEYEPDDYAYVQNRRATRMFYIEGYAQGNGLGGLVANTTDSILYKNGSNSGNRTFKDYVVINTGGFDVSQLTTDALLKKVFLEDINKYIFFKANVLLKTLSTPALREDVTGYFERDPGKPLIAIGTDKVGIPIKLTRDAKNKDPKPIHPITLATFQMMRLEMPEIAYNAKGSFPNPNESFFKSVQKTFNTSLGSDLKNLLNGYEQEGMRKKWAQISGVGAGDHATTSPTSKRSFFASL